jgi:GTP pyrophosphokinase
VQDKLKVGKGDRTRIVARLAENLEAGGVEAELSSRVKRYYSIYRKLRRQGVDISQLYDYLAFRIVTKDVRDCYAALGVVHQCWRPVPGRFKDYIAMPKPNLYQSLHTTVIGEKGQPFEVQIRTVDMDVIAEEGIAAHWRYKQGAGGEGRPDEDAQVPWLRQLLEWQQEVSDPRAFMTALKIDLYPDEVYVFTPKGDVLSFPRGATPLDFAYKVHTELGHHCVGARINGKLEPLRTPLRNGDMVEVLTSSTRYPSRDWLSFVRTSRARSKIRHWLSTEQNKRSMEIGQRLLERELRRYKLSLKKLLDSDGMPAFLESEGLSRSEDMLSRIGFGRLQPRQVVRRILGETEAHEVPDPGRLRKAVTRILPFGSSSPIVVSGQGDLLAYLAKCCSPLPGDEIVGYVTRGRGVAVHAVDCANVKQLIYNPEREIDVAWVRSGDDRYPVSLVIHTEDHPGILAKLTDVIAKHDSNIKQIEADTEVEGRGLISVVVEVRNRKHLDKLRGGIRKVPGVIEVGRKMGAVPVAEG